VHNIYADKKYGNYRLLSARSRANTSSREIASERNFHSVPNKRAHSRRVSTFERTYRYLHFYLRIPFEHSINPCANATHLLSGFPRLLAVCHNRGITRGIKASLAFAFSRNYNARTRRSNTVAKVLAKFPETSPNTSERGSRRERRARQVGV